MSFLTAEYDYDMDIKVNREEAFEDGLEQGADQASIDIIKHLMLKNYYDVDQALEAAGISEEKREKYKKIIEEDNSNG